MNKKLIILVFIFSALATSAQNWLGLSNGNYSGTNGIYLNPSSIVDSRVGGYINFFGFGANMYNNYLSYSGPKSLFRALRDTTFNIGDDNIKENLNGKDKVVNFSNELRGPSFMVSILPKHAIGISTRNRFFVQAVDVSQPIARMIRWGFDSTTTGFSGPDGLSYEQLYTETRFGINVNNFTEIGFTYATVLMDRDKHFLKAGITYKYLAGTYSAFFKNDGGGGVTIKGTDSLELSNTNVQYGYVGENLYKTDTNSYGLDFSRVFGPNRVGKGYGLDIGFTYEFRPNYKNYRYTLDGKERWDKTENKYFLRVSGTLMDLGRITYSDSRYVRNNTLARNRVVTWGSIDTVSEIFNQLGNTGPDESVVHRFDDAVGAVLGFDNQSNEFVSKLPTAFNIQADVKVINNVYVNAMWLQGLRRKGEIGARQFSMLAVTPRFETRWFEASIPLVLNNDYRNFSFGLFARFGPFFIGSDNITGLFKSTNVNGFDIYGGMSLPIFRRNPRDRDGDGVSDRKDRCRQVAGKLEFWGCPDSDGDGVQDDKDKCPDVYGDTAFMGCPDTDKDGIQDTKDSCPEIKGLPQFNGCPDSDGDGIQDSKDDCPNEAGLEGFNGCPDSDADGVKDSDDDCPQTPGLKEFNGCPDSDGDGIQDKEDKCPEIKGLPEYEGCPDTDGDNIPDHQDKCPEIKGLPQFKGCPDTDGDGVPDNKDLCALEPGLPENNGCPKVEEQLEIIELDKEEEKVLKEAFDNLEFETGKAVIQKESFKSLDELILLLNAKPEYRIYIAGHTDNVGGKAFNIKLSKDRANVVREYLLANKIGKERIKVEGFGEARPIASNKTPEGRQKNRRVEFRIIK